MKRYQRILFFCLIMLVLNGLVYNLEKALTQYWIYDSDTQAIQESLSWISLQISEVCGNEIYNLKDSEYYTDSTDSTYQSDTYCNSVWCRSSEDAFLECDKIPNTDEHKFDYIEVCGIKNYFNALKYK